MLSLVEAGGVVGVLCLRLARSVVCSGSNNPQDYVRNYQIAFEFHISPYRPVVRKLLDVLFGGYALITYANVGVCSCKGIH
jgi:hypothetical protein